MAICNCFLGLLASVLSICRQTTQKSDSLMRFLPSQRRTVEGRRQFVVWLNILGGLSFEEWSWWSGERTVAYFIFLVYFCLLIYCKASFPGLGNIQHPYTIFGYLLVSTSLGKKLASECDCVKLFLDNSTNERYQNSTPRSSTSQRLSHKTKNISQSVRLLPFSIILIHSYQMLTFS